MAALQAFSHEAEVQEMGCLAVAHVCNGSGAAARAALREVTARRDSMLLVVWLCCGRAHGCGSDSAELLLGKSARWEAVDKRCGSSRRAWEPASL